MAKSMRSIRVRQELREKKRLRADLTFIVALATAAIILYMSLRV